MKILTIKELAPYLPYGLKVLSERGTVYELDVYYNMMGNGIEKRDLYSVLDNGMKPLLRPLSSLTEEIEHNGERFIPINKLKHLYGWDYLWYEVLGEITNFNVNKLKYACLKLLLEWNFDVFGLIDRNLALPIEGKEVEGE